MKFDFATYGADGHLSLVLEAKKRLGTSPNWAKEFRRNLLVHGSLPMADYFGIVTPDYFYWWKAGSAPEESPTVVEAKAVFEPYLSRIKVSVGEIQPQAFEHVVSWWLNDVVSGTFDTATAPELGPVVKGATGGRVEREIAA